jgi:hypothetical protein
MTRTAARRTHPNHAWTMPLRQSDAAWLSVGFCPSAIGAPSCNPESRRPTDKEDLARLHLTEVGRPLDAGELTGFVDAVAPFAQASDAHWGKVKSRLDRGKRGGSHALAEENSPFNDLTGGRRVSHYPPFTTHKPLSK